MNQLLRSEPCCLNPIPDLISWPDLEGVQKQRLIILEEILNISKKRMADWSFVRAVLSAIWSLEDGGELNYRIKIAEVLQRIEINNTSEVLMTSEVY